jgi:hypothetical protein
LLSYSSFINYEDTNPFHLGNIKTPKNHDIILPNNPKLLLSFFQEIPLNKDLFSIKGYDFYLNYLKINDCSS